MGVRGDFVKLRKSLFKAFGDFVQTSITVSDDPVSTYDPATGQNVVTYGNSQTVTGFVRRYRQDEIAGEIQAGDAEIILDSDAITELFQPTGKLAISGVSYIVVRLVPVPFSNSVIQKVHVRQVAA